VEVMICMTADSEYERAHIGASDRVVSSGYFIRFRRSEAGFVFCSCSHYRPHVNLYMFHVAIQKNCYLFGDLPSQDTNEHKLTC
jgi:hypothetical protein